MEWADRGLVLGLRRHGETSVVAEFLTERHGRHFGFVHGGRSRVMRPLLQQGNRLNLLWRARLEEHLGQWRVEAEVLRAGRLMLQPAALQGLHWLCALLRLLPEREPHAKLFSMADSLAERLDDLHLAPELLIRFELALLSELGFGLDLSQCALTGETENLGFVSPKTGRAASAAAGAPWADKLFVLPLFLTQPWGTATPQAEDIAAGFRLTEYFMNRDLFSPRGLEMPLSRTDFIRKLDR